MSKLYELTAEYKRFLELIENGEIPEEAITDTLEALDSEVDSKIDNIACIIKQLLGEAEIIKNEIDALTERRKRKIKKAESLANYLSLTMKSLGKLKFESGRNQICFKPSKGVRITDDKAFLNWARENAPNAIITKESASLSVIAELIKTTNVPYAVIEERSNIQIK